MSFNRRKNVNNCRKLNELFKAAKSARCFCRFPIPVILIDKKVLHTHITHHTHSHIMRTVITQYKRYFFLIDHNYNTEYMSMFNSCNSCRALW